VWDLGRFGLASTPDKVLYWKYDVMGRVTEKGYITSVTWGDGSALQSYADTSLTFPQNPATWRKRYSYDSSGTYQRNYAGKLNCVQTNNDDDSTAEVNESFTYDKYGNMTSVNQKAVDFDAATYTTTFNYDRLHRTSEIVYPAINNKPLDVVYTYDQVGRTKSVGVAGGLAFANYTYGNFGAVDTETYLPGRASATPISYSYDGRGRFTGVYTDYAFSEDIFYDNGGYHSSEGFYHGLIAMTTYYCNIGNGPSNFGYTYQYDKFGRLITANATPTSVDSMDVGVVSATQYDANGNITAIARAKRALQTYSYYTGTNRVQSTSGGTQYTYDVTGNLTYSAPLTDTLKYDPFTQLTMKEKKANNDSTILEYGGAKQLVLRSATISGATTNLLYFNVNNELPLAVKSSTGSGNWSYVYGPQGLIAARKDSIWYYVQKDHLGSIRLVFDTTAAVANSYYDYDVYGKLRRSTENVQTRYRFTGQELDLMSGLYNFRARQYDGDIGIFYAADPTNSSFSPYGYVSGNPVSRVDPTGMVDWTTSVSNQMTQNYWNRPGASNWNMLRGTEYDDGSGWTIYDDAALFGWKIAKFSATAWLYGDNYKSADQAMAGLNSKLAHDAANIRQRKVGHWTDDMDLEMKQLAVPHTISPNGIADLSGGYMIPIVGAFKTSCQGMEFIMRREGDLYGNPLLNVYLDSKGHPTIGWGHLDVEGYGTINSCTADCLFENDVETMEKGVLKRVSSPLAQNQLDALVSWAFQWGPGAIRSSGIASAIDAGHYNDVPNLMLDYQNNAPLYWMRRCDEVIIWTQGIYYK
jgi:RHS repeat-associated protein